MIGSNTMRTRYCCQEDEDNKKALLAIIETNKILKGLKGSYFDSRVSALLVDMNAVLNTRSHVETALEARLIISEYSEMGASYGYVWRKIYETLWWDR